MMFLCGKIPSNSFTFRQAKLCRLALPRVPWIGLVWHKGHIPCRAFILWLTVQHKSYTLDKFLSLNVVAHNSCFLCNSCEETHDQVARSVWDNVAKELNWPSSLLDRNKCLSTFVDDKNLGFNLISKVACAAMFTTFGGRET